VIVPVTDDMVWQNEFSSLPLLTVPVGPVLVIAPHPDDETLGAGGLIATLRRNDVRVVVVAATDGENAYETTLAERKALGETRESEQRDALAILGVPNTAIKRLRLTDSGLTAQEADLTDAVAQLAETDMTLLAPWSGDFHPDHEACARAASHVSAAKGLPLMSYFFWTWHRGAPEMLRGQQLRRFEPDSVALAAKAEALRRHRSQLERSSGDPILPDRLLAPARWPYEVFLSA
jgi:LmbE family N-acetylglucosaminyl deacetylase